MFNIKKRKVPFKENSPIERGSTRLAVKVGFWYVASTFLVKATAFITTPIFSRLMNQKAYGEFSNFASWRSILLIIVGLELYNTIPRAYYDFKNDFDNYIANVTIFGALFTCALYLLFLLGQNTFLQLVSIPAKYVHILFLSLLVTSFKSIYLMREKTLYHYKTAAMISFLDGVIPPIVSFIAVVKVQDALKLSARIYGFYGTSLVTGILCGISLLRQDIRIRWDYLRYAVKLALPLQVNFLSVYVLTNINVVITKNIVGPSTAAVVSIAGSVVHIVSILFQSLNGAITTWLMDKLNQKQYQETKKETFVIICLFGVITMGVILFAPEVVYILGGSKYAASVALIPGLAIAAFIQAISTIFTTILTYDKNVLGTAVFTGIVAVVSTTVKLQFLPKYGIACLPIINVLAAIVLLIGNYILVRRAGYGQIIDIKNYVLLIGGLIILMVISDKLFSNLLVRYFIIGVLATIFIVMIVKNKNKLISLIHGTKQMKVDL